jgi:hypothetical protein
MGEGEGDDRKVITATNETRMNGVNAKLKSCKVGEKQLLSSWIAL